MKTRHLTTLSTIIILSLLLTMAGLGAAPPWAGAAALYEPEAVSAMPPPEHTFEGLSRTTYDADSAVPDTSGDVGITRYIQAVNESVAIYSKTGSAIASASFEQFWAYADTNTACDGYYGEGQEQGNHHGQPNVLYDHMLQRWLVMDVAYADALNGPYFFCIAVTDAIAGESPTVLDNTQWLFYALATNDMTPYYYPDQPRVGLWPDGYYIAADMYDDYNNGVVNTPKGAKVWVVNRDDLLNGVAAFRAESVVLPEGTGYHGLLPSNLRGDPPPNGTPNFLVAVAPQTNFYIWNFSVEWFDWGGNVDFSTTPTVIPTATPFFISRGYFVPQAGTAEQLDILGDRLNSVMYRYMDGKGILWASHSVLNADGGTDLRWYEVREPESSPFFYHQGSYHPNSRYHWISSIAADGEGNLAVGYSASSSGMYPGIRYAGRLATDPVNELSQGEANFLPSISTTYQDNANGIADGAWGRKSAMTVDPVDDCVFWYTNQYYNDSHEAWRTRIGWFRFPTCKAGTTARISLHTNGTQGNGASGDPLELYSVSSSRSGRWVAFTSEATNLVNRDTNGKRDVFVRDRDVDDDGIFDEPGQVATTRVSLTTDDGESNGHSFEVSISDDGRFVAFSSEASNLVGSDGNGTRDIFVRDRDLDRDGVFDEPGESRTFRVSIPDGGGQSNGLSDQPSIDVDYDSDGSPYIYVAFRSFANNLIGVGNDNNNVSDIFLYFDNPYGIWTERVSVANNEAEANGESYQPSLSASIDFLLDLLPIYTYRVAFTSRATNLYGTDDNGVSDVFVRSNAGTTRRVSLTDADVQANGESYHPSISGNGRYVAFISRATDIPTVPPMLADSNGVADVFVRDTLMGTTTRVSLSFLGAEANKDSYTPSISYDGQFIAFASDATTLNLMAEYNGVRDIFLHDQVTKLTKRISNGFNGETDGLSVAPAISGDGRHVAYPSFATNLVTNDTNNVWDVFAHDREGIIPVFLTIASNVLATPGSQVSVPLYFTGHGQSIDTTAFSVDYDQECLTYTGVTFSLPASFDGSVSPNPGDVDGELDFTIKYKVAGVSLPEGILLTMKFNVSPACQTAPDTSRSARVGFSKAPPASFGKSGASIRGKTVDGFVEVFDGLLGDCNADGKVDAGDVSALTLEIFDGDGQTPASTPLGTFKGNPVGCNPNQDIVVDAGDISCDLLMIFGRTCGGSNSLTTLSPLQTYAPLAGPSLEMPAEIAAGPGDRVTIPITLQTNGHSINQAAFAVTYDPAVLTIDPKAVKFSLPAGFDGQIAGESYANGKVGFVITGSSKSTLVDGTILSLTFTVNQGTAADSTMVAFSRSNPLVSFGTTSGVSAKNVTVTDSNIVLRSVPRKIFIPMLIRK